jgi:glutamate synthase domain-containing protein 3
MSNMLGRHGGEMMGDDEIIIDALDEDKKPMRYWVLNEKVHDAADNGSKHIILKNVLGQRFIADAMEHKDLKIDIYGTPGNDLGVFMDGPVIEVHGNCEDQTGNTLNSGKIIVHGDAWDVTGLAARGGTILVKGNGGYRIGIHMKEYQEHRPIIVYGGCAKEFFGEYMAGGILVALGLEFKNGNAVDVESKDIIRGNLGTGIHGGAIYVRGDVSEKYLGVGATLQPFTEEDRELLTPIFNDFCEYFGVPIDKIWEKDIKKIAPASSRPYGGYYNPKSV